MALRTQNTSASSLPHAIRFLVARIGVSCFAFPADWVRGIVTASEAGSGPTVTWAGADYERTDLGARLACTDHHPSDSDARIILYGNNDRSRAFVVDAVIGLVDVLRHDIRPLPPHFRRSERERLVGLFVDDSSIALIINPLWILGLPTSKDGLATLGQSASPHRAAQTLQLTDPHVESPVTLAGKGP
jgi:chemotaxis protein histidine kinase CheA